jgi:hypothetical protein
MIARDREHLLLAARQAAGHRPAPQGQAREKVVAAVQVGGDGAAVAPPQRAHHEVLRRGEPAERPAPLWDVGDAEPRDLVGPQPGEVAAVETDGAAPPHRAADRPQRRRLARAVRAEQRRDGPFGDLEVDAMKYLAALVAGGEAGHLEKARQRSPHAAVPR